jgi:ketosteroid isomerase-like protein
MVAQVATDNLATAHALIDGLARLNVADAAERLERGDESVLATAAPLLEMIDDEVVWDTSALEIADMGEFHGHAGVIAFWRQWLAEWDTWSFQASNFQQLGSHVIFDVANRGRSRRVGAQLDWPQSVAMTFRGGKLLTYRGFNTRADALESIR